MAKNDKWCEFCNDRNKSEKIMVDGKENSVCKSCKSMATEDKKVEV